MSARKVGSMRCLGRVLFIALVASVAVIELLVAVKFNEIEFLSIGISWPINLELPAMMTIFGMWAGAMLWVTLVGAVWTETYKKNANGLTVVEAAVVTSVAAIPVYGIIAGPFAFAVWANALLWSFAVLFFCQRFGKAES